jgi:hypothetical protein
MGIRIFGMLNCRASALACIGPAPPKATITKSRGSNPRCTEITRIAPTMLAFAISMIPLAASTGFSPSRDASRSTARQANSGYSLCSPPRK